MEQTQLLLTIQNQNNAILENQTGLQDRLAAIEKDVHYMRQAGTETDKKANEALTLLRVEKELREKNEVKQERDKNLLYENYRKEIKASEEKSIEKIKTNSLDNKNWALLKFMTILGVALSFGISIIALLKK